MGRKMLPQVKICLEFTNDNNEYFLLTDTCVTKFAVFEEYTGNRVGRTNISGECHFKKVLIVTKYNSQRSCKRHSNWNIIEQFDIPDFCYEYKDEKDLIRELREMFGAMGLVHSNGKGGVWATSQLGRMVNRSISKNKATFEVPECGTFAYMFGCGLPYR